MAAVPRNLTNHPTTTHPCTARVDVLEAGDVPILFSLPQMKNLGMTFELDPKGEKITCPAFGLYSSPPEYFTKGHIALDLTSLGFQPKSRERPAHPRRNGTFAVSEHTSKNPAHTRDLEEDEDDEPLVHPDRTAVTDDEDDQSLVQPTSRKKLVKEKDRPAGSR